MQKNINIYSVVCLVLCAYFHSKVPWPRDHAQVTCHVFFLMTLALGSQEWLRMLNCAVLQSMTHSSVLISVKENKPLPLLPALSTPNTPIAANFKKLAPRGWRRQGKKKIHWYKLPTWFVHNYDYHDLHHIPCIWMSFCYDKVSFDIHSGEPDCCNVAGYLGPDILAKKLFATLYSDKNQVPEVQA